MLPTISTGRQGQSRPAPRPCSAPGLRASDLVIRSEAEGEGSQAGGAPCGTVAAACLAAGGQ